MGTTDEQDENKAENKDVIHDQDEDGEIKETTIPTPPAKRRKCGRESLLEQKLEQFLPSETVIRSSNIIWVDLEMTGLDITKHHILEIACIITDKHLNVLAEGPNLVIHQTEEVLKGMTEWCIEQHGKSGLTEESRKSTISLKEAENQIINFVKQYCPKGRCELAGNSIHCDRRFIETHMPNFLEWLHYRIIDVSSIRNVCWRLYPDFVKFNENMPAASHRSLDDIRFSIKELQHYRDTVFKSRDQYTADINERVNPAKESFDELMSHFERSTAATPRAPNLATSTTAAVAGGQTSGKQEPISVTIGGERITLFADK